MIADLCPFRMQMAGPHPRNADLHCVGKGCMFFMQTSVGAEGQPIGGCSPAVAVTQLFMLNNNLAAVVQRLGLHRPPWYVRLWTWIKAKFEKPLPAPIPLHPPTQAAPDVELPPTA